MQAMRATRRTLLQAHPTQPLQRATAIRTMQTSAPHYASSDIPSGAAATQDALGASRDQSPAKGRTGGGEPLGSSSENAVPKPKISNNSVPGVNTDGELTKEQKEEVDRHNKDFDAKHDHSEVAPGDKVDKKFWSGEGH